MKISINNEDNNPNITYKSNPITLPEEWKAALPDYTPKSKKITIYVEPKDKWSKILKFFFKIKNNFIRFLNYEIEILTKYSYIINFLLVFYSVMFLIFIIYNLLKFNKV
jgi:energy-converting hydrogenase Eha subunit F